MQQKNTRLNWMDHLRGFITLLVVAHHSSLAYTTFAQFNKDAYILSTHPVVDAARWKGMDIFEDFNDIFFMSLMFLISGVFVKKSIETKGTKSFLQDRFFRLFVPFIIGVTLLMLLAYFPAFYLAQHSTNISDYITDFFTTEAWPVGPPWFIWVLFLFNLAAAMLFPLVKNLPAKWAGKIATLKRDPFKIVLALFVFTWLLYIPMMLYFGPDAWTGIGPFDFQQSRLLLYFGYFLLGIIIGAPGFQNGLFTGESALAQRWPLWLGSCLVVYAALKMSEPPLRSLLDQQEAGVMLVTILYRSVWVLSCSISCIAFLAIFMQRFKRSTAWWRSLSANAYGIYLLHYIFVVWMQYFLLDAELPALVKFLLTFLIAVTVSWLGTMLVRKIPVVKKYL